MTYKVLFEMFRKFCLIHSTPKKMLSYQIKNVYVLSVQSLNKIKLGTFCLCPYYITVLSK